MAAKVAVAVKTATRRSETAFLRREDVLSRNRLDLREGENWRSHATCLSLSASRPIESLTSGAVPSVANVSEGFSRGSMKEATGRLRFHSQSHETVFHPLESGLPAPQVAAIRGHREFRMLSRNAKTASDRQKPYRGFRGLGEVLAR
jgi:hypothetical protein